MNDQIDRKLLHEALLDTFSRPDLERLLDFELGTRLDNIAPQTAFSAVVFDVIKHFVQRDQLHELVRVAQEARPNNRKLQQLTTNQPPASTSSTSPSHTTHIHVGDGGVYVGGDAGDIITGDNNSKK